MTQKTVFGIVALAIMLVVGGWFRYGFISERQIQMGQKQQEQRENENAQPIETVVDTLAYIGDTSRWNTIKTEFFLVKFPWTWSWVVPDKDPFPYSLVTNNVRVASKWFMASDEVGVIENEITILFNSGLTLQVSDDKKTDAEIIKESFDDWVYHNQKDDAVCQITQKAIPSILQCVYKTSDESMHYAYYIANRRHTVIASVYANTHNKLVYDIVDKIIQSIDISK